MPRRERDRELARRRKRREKRKKLRAKGLLPPSTSTQEVKGGVEKKPEKALEETPPKGPKVEGEPLSSEG